jgi:hypothetical protein
MAVEGWGNQPLPPLEDPAQRYTTNAQGRTVLRVPVGIDQSPAASEPGAEVPASEKGGRRRRRGKKTRKTRKSRKGKGRKGSTRRR